MLNYKKIFSIDPFSMPQSIKNKWYLENQKKLSSYHYKNCKEYREISNSLFKKIKNTNDASELPFVHTEIFKEYNLKSTGIKNLTITLTSSGTSKNNISKINLDLKTSLIQSRALSKIYENIIENRDSVIFFIDSPNVIKGKLGQSARGAAIKGFGQLVKNSFFLLDENYNLKINKLINFINKNPKDEFILFGFTSFVWTYLVKKLIKNKVKIPNNNGILIHGGGWKKMEDQSVNKNLFNSTITKITKIKSIHSYYGMVEQTGSIFIECKYGYYHCSIFSEIFIRDGNLNLSNFKKKGLVQVLSLLPISYPGHNILTEDTGAIIGVDNCKCGRKGKYFSIMGRVAGTQLRGCSDVY